MEALLFSFGVGVGMLSAASTNKAEAERMSELLQLAQTELQNLKRALERRGGSTAEMNSQSEDVKYFAIFHPIYVFVDKQEEV